MSKLNIIENALVKEAFAITDATDVSAKTGTGTTVVMQTSPTITSPTIADVSSMAVQSSTGRKAMNVLRVAADVISAETVTIGADVYEVEIVNTDTTDDTAGATWNNTTDPLSIVEATYPNVPTGVGSLIRVENEIMRVTATGANLTLARGQSGTTTVAHADALDIYEGNGIAGGSTIAVGLVATLTPTAFTPALVADINGRGVEAVTATQISVNEILIEADAVGAVALACSEALTGANNGWPACATPNSSRAFRPRQRSGSATCTLFSPSPSRRRTSASGRRRRRTVSLRLGMARPRSAAGA